VKKNLFNFSGFLFTATFIKLLLNVARRLVYPFALEFERELNVELSAITSVIAVNQATSILGPVGAVLQTNMGTDF
jgi:hypothetical protein